MSDNIDVLNENTLINQPILLGEVDKIMVKESIARRVSEVQPLRGPVGIIQGSRYDKVNDKLIIETQQIDAVTKQSRSEFSLETIQDMKSLYGKDFYKVMARYLADDIIYQIDTDFISMVKANSSLFSSLVFDVSYDTLISSVGTSISIAVNKGLSDMAFSDHRSSGAWAIVSSDIASLLAGSLSKDSSLDDNSPSYLGNIAGVEYYIDFTHNNSSVDNVIFGIKGNGISKGSTIFAPYNSLWYETVDSSSGENVGFLMIRQGQGVNPLDKEFFQAGLGTSAFLGRLNVDVSALKIFL